MIRFGTGLAFEESAVTGFDGEHSHRYGKRYQAGSNASFEDRREGKPALKASTLLQHSHAAGCTMKVQIDVYCWGYYAGYTAGAAS